MGELPPIIAAALNAGATILTPSQRAARSLRRAWDHAQQAAGLTVWPSPAILHFDTWLTALHQSLLLQGHETRILLNRSQTHALWRSIIEQVPDLPALQSPDALADLAARAARLLHLYAGTANAREFTLATDTRAFQRWAQAFDRLCTREGFLTESQLPAILGDALSRGQLTIPPLVLVDFDTLPPAQAVLLASIEQAGYEIQRIESAATLTSSELHAAPDAASELHAAAYWVRSLLELNPAARIAIVVPALESRRAEIDGVFAQILAPELQSILHADAPLPYEFSLGIPLTHTAAVATALPLLRWPAEPLPLTTISDLLLSPFFGASAGPTAAQALAAATFDAHQLRRTPLLRPELSLTAFTHLVAQSRQPLGLEPRLRHLSRAVADSTTTQPHTAWAGHFRACLKAAGWAVAADSLTFQAIERWESVLDELATLDFHGPLPNRAEALATLTRLARQTIFAPESRQAPVQILGPLELGGLPFDALWFLGADDFDWPPPTSPNPLIPYTLQRALAMPGTDAAREAAQARALTARISRSAASVVFSYAAQSAEGSRRPSPALESLPLTPFIPATLPRPQPVLALEAYPDNLEIPALPDRVFSGGARILELQAACPFRAFAELRLHAGQPETREPGLNPGESGQLVHTVMESFWAEAATQEALRTMGEPARHSLLDRSIAAALAEAQAHTRTPWDVAYLEIQFLRLQQLLRPWLAVELERPNFAVASHERNLRDISIGPLRLHLRVDRIDDTAGGPLILDYKTGPAAPADWLTDRPDAPQLPLYAVVTATGPGAELGGVAFANLRAGDGLTLKGFAESPAVLAKPSRMDAATLADQVDQWRAHLVTLATAFAAGDARVDPKSYPKTCTRCTQRLLCRLEPATLTHIDDEETQAPAGYGESNA